MTHKATWHLECWHGASMWTRGCRFDYGEGDL